MSFFPSLRFVQNDSYEFLSHSQRIRPIPTVDLL